MDCAHLFCIQMFTCSRTVCSKDKTILPPRNCFCTCIELSCLYPYLFILFSVPRPTLSYRSHRLSYSVLRSGTVGLLSPFFMKLVFALLAPLHFHLNLSTSLSTVTKKPIIILLETVPILDQPGERTGMLTILSSKS